MQEYISFLRLPLRWMGEKLINAVPCITDLQKDFYKQYLNKRYELMIRPAYELVNK